MSHIHATNMLTYAHDAQESSTPWDQWEWFDPTVNAWVELATHPRWVENAQYRKKSHTIKIGDIEFPRPIQTKLKTGTIYYIPLLDNPYIITQKCTWTDSSGDMTLLNRGLIHLTHVDATKHAEAIFACTKLQN